MGKIITDSNGKVLMDSNGGVYEATAAIDSNITAGNIKNGVQILGVTGNYGDADCVYSECDVRFVDYDGKELITMTKEELLTLSELPTYPASHEGLTFVEWNWTLAEAKAYATKYGCALIGATLKTTDDSTRIIINIPYDNCKFKVTYKQSKASGVLVDWGDETSVRSGAANSEIIQRHVYEKAGKYVITETPDVDCVLTPHSNSYPSLCGYSFSSQAFQFLMFIEEVNIGRIKSGSYINTWLRNMKRYSIPNMSVSVQSSNGSLSLLRAIVLPRMTTSYRYGIGAASAKIISLPHGLSSIVGSFFASSITAIELIIPEGVTSIGNSAFSYAYQARRIVVPESVQSIGTSAFSVCTSCESIVLSEGLLTIGDSAFSGCCSCNSITIPSTVTSIGKYCFSWNTANENLNNFNEVHVKPTTPPTLGTNAFATKTGFKIYVPAEYVDTYKGATGWSGYSSYIEAEPTT